jgi:type IV pilus assembly protein PilO
MNDTRKWSLVAMVAVLGILAAGWFLLVAPKRTEAADLKTKTAAQDKSNSGLEAQLSQLKEQQADLPKQQARLAVIRRQLPDNPALPQLIRTLTTAARQVGVSLDAMSPSTPVPLAAAQPVAPVPAPTTSTDSSSTDSTATDTAPVVPPTPPAPTLYQIPLSLNVTGSYFEMEQFVGKLEGLKRSLLVTGFTVTPASGEGQTAGDLRVTLQGRVFIAPPAAAAAATTTPVAPATTGQ